MSTADSSSSPVPSHNAVIAKAGDKLMTTVRAAAFWATIPLPLVIVGTLLTGHVTSTPLFVAGLVLLNVLCAVFGHSHSPTA